MMFMALLLEPRILSVSEQVDRHDKLTCNSPEVRCMGICWRKADHSHGMVAIILDKIHRVKITTVITMIQKVLHRNCGCEKPRINVKGFLASNDIGIDPSDNPSELLEIVFRSSYINQWCIDDQEFIKRSVILALMITNDSVCLG